jgi:hypothetical protein
MRFEGEKQIEIFTYLKKTFRQNMNSLSSQIHKTGEQFPTDFVRDRIACLPKIIIPIIAKMVAESNIKR